MILVYPVGYLWCLDFTPSLLKALNETLLTHTLIEIVYNMYLNEKEELLSDPYVSPLSVNISMIQKLPPISIYFGTWDPLYDDGFWLFQKLVLNGN